MLQKNVIPPHAGIKSRINHKFPPLDRMNVHIADSQVEFKAHPGGDGRRKIMLNNFNATVSQAPGNLGDEAYILDIRVEIPVCC